MQKLKNKFAEFDLKAKLSNILPLVENNSSKIIIERTFKNLNFEDITIDNMKVVTERQENNILVNRIKLLESLVNELRVYDWHKDINAFIKESQRFLSENSLLIILESIVYDLRSDKNSKYYEKAITKIVTECSESENPIESILESLEEEKWIPLIGRLYEYASTLKGSYNGKNPNFEVCKVYTPIEIIGESYLIHSNGLNLLVDLERNNVSKYNESLSNNFISLCQIAENAKFTTDSMRIYPNNKHSIDIKFVNESVNVLLDGKEINPKDLDTYLVTKGIVSFNESAKLGSIQRAINEGNSIKNLDIAYKVNSKLYEGLSATVFNVNDKLFVQLTNHGMKLNNIVESESVKDAIDLVKEHMNFDITESVKYLIDEENKIEFEKQKQINDIEDKISFLKENINKINKFEKENGESESILNAKKVLEDELSVFESKKKELLIDKKEDDFVEAEISKGSNLYNTLKNKNIKVNALEYTKSGNSDKVGVIDDFGNDFDVEKKFITVKL